MNRLLRVMLASLLGVTPLAASGAIAAETPYTINVILPLTGPGAFIGQTDQKALKVLESLANKQGGIRGRPLQFAFSDDQSNPQVSVQVANQILASKPAVVLGPGIAGLCTAAAPVFAAAKTFDWCLSPTIYPPVGGYVYAAQVGSKDLNRGQVRYIRERGFKRIAILSTTDVSGRTGESELVDVLKLPENRNLSVVAGEAFAPTDVSVAAQLAKIKAASPDALCIWTAGAALGTALTGIRDAGMQDLPIFANSAAMVYTQMLQLSAVIPKDLYFVGFGYTSGHGKNAAAARKLQAFDEGTKAADMHIDGVTGLAWDPAAITIDALRAIGPDATSEQVRSWVASQKSYPGISGLYDFRNDMHGLGVDDIAMVRWDAQKKDWVTVSKFGGKPL